MQAKGKVKAKAKGKAKPKAKWFNAARNIGKAEDAFDAKVIALRKTYDELINDLEAGLADFKVDPDKAEYARALSRCEVIMKGMHAVRSSDRKQLNEYIDSFSAKAASSGATSASHERLTRAGPCA